MGSVGCPIGERRHEPRDLAIAIGLGQFTLRQLRLALLGLDRPGAQHQMRKIEVEFMRRHIGAFRHETHVAERAGIDDRLEVFAIDGIQFAIGGGVDEVEKARKRIAEIEAAAAAVTNIEDPPQFGVELGFVIKIRILPVQRMPGRGFKTTFTHAIPL